MSMCDYYANACNDSENEQEINVQVRKTAILKKRNY